MAGRSLEPEPPAATGEVELPPEAEEALALPPAGIRDRLAGELAHGYEDLANAFKEAMGKAEKDVWLSCRKCGRKEVYAGPDYKTRLDAAVKWMELVLGKPKPSEGRDPLAAVKDITALSDEELAEIVSAGDEVAPAA